MVDWICPPLEDVPDDTDFDESEPAKWRIPGTPLRIVRIEDGPREGEFLFSARTIDIVPWLYQRIAHRPLRSILGIDSWVQAMPQLHGPLIPADLVSELPDGLKMTWLDTPIWKILTVVLLIVLAALLLLFWHRLVYRRVAKERATASVLYLLSPVAIIAATPGAQAGNRRRDRGYRVLCPNGRFRDHTGGLSLRSVGILAACDHGHGMGHSCHRKFRMRASTQIFSV